ncbi:hypothetical protein HZS_7397 [Henneguya salminicola]|nr:hypothetical protein HZS_7397 [Henneguya salminicola]
MRHTCVFILQKYIGAKIILCKNRTNLQTIIIFNACASIREAPHLLRMPNEYAFNNFDIFICPKKSSKKCACIEKYIWGEEYENIQIENLKCLEAKKFLIGLNEKAIQLHKIRCLESDEFQKKVRKNKVNSFY